MIAGLLVLLAVTFFATWWARELAIGKRRHVGGWMFATVMLPLMVLILWALPERTVPAHRS